MNAGSLSQWIETHGALTERVRDPPATVLKRYRSPNVDREIDRDSKDRSEIVSAGSTRWCPSAPGSNGVSWYHTKRDVTAYHGDVTACHA
eukprot:1373320-Amorphochlora_amoeboformis.AAC.1